jgi:hypothetical protein
MTTKALSRVETPSYSFYVNASNPELIQRAAILSGSVTVRGRTGPRIIEQIELGADTDVMFDFASYEKPGSTEPLEAWLERQRIAGAKRVLTPGRWIESSKDPGYCRQVLHDEVSRVDATDGTDAVLLFAVHHHWLTRHADAVASVLGELARPAALVLGHKGDPLSVGGAVDGMIHITKRASDLSLLRIDHGGIGGVAFGAAHASFGLRAGNRHVVPPGKSAWGKPYDSSARLFVKDKLDWFTAITIAGWATAEVPERCDLECCDGKPLSRYLDNRLASDAERHNMIALADVASYIVNAGPNERRRLFAELCKRAVGQYDRLASMGIVPKSQLQAWALWA